MDKEAAWKENYADLKENLDALMSAINETEARIRWNGKIVGSNDDIINIALKKFSENLADIAFESDRRFYYFSKPVRFHIRPYCEQKLFGYKRTTKLVAEFGSPELLVIAMARATFSKEKSIAMGHVARFYDMMLNAQEPTRKRLLPITPYQLAIKYVPPGVQEIKHLLSTETRHRTESVWLCPSDSSETFGKEPVREIYAGLIHFCRLANISLTQSTGFGVNMGFVDHENYLPREMEDPVVKYNMFWP